MKSALTQWLINKMMNMEVIHKAMNAQEIIDLPEVELIRYRTVVGPDPGFPALKKDARLNIPMMVEVYARFVPKDEPLFVTDLETGFHWRVVNTPDGLFKTRYHV